VDAQAIWAQDLVPEVSTKAAQLGLAGTTVHVMMRAVTLSTQKLITPVGGITIFCVENLVGL
jgi:hypothetical protein